MSKHVQAVLSPLGFTIEIVPKKDGYYAVVYCAGLEWYRTILVVDRRFGDRSLETKKTVVNFARYWIECTHPAASVLSIDTVQ